VNIDTSNKEKNEINKQENIKENKNMKVKIYEIIKRSIDIFGALIGIILLIPVTIVIYIVRIFFKENDGPLFYTQKRIGKGGKYFRLYKYRSMCKDADDKLAKYLAENEEARLEFKETQKLQNDPRVTKLGNILRKTSLDELPQLFNILKGEMSFIGPRPWIVDYAKHFTDEQMRRLDVLPGITGLAQSSGRNAIGIIDRINLDVEYVDNMSLLLDIKIIFKTVIGIIKKEGFSNTKSAIHEELKILEMQHTDMYKEEFNKNKLVKDKKHRINKKKQRKEDKVLVESGA